MSRHIILLVSFLFIFGCSQKRSCENLPSSFNSYKEAHEIIKNTKFNHIDEVNTSKSSWIKGAKFYSCDNNFGFFILKTGKQDYIYQNLPRDIWDDFKNAESFGRFYNKKIKNRYQLILITNN